MSHLALYTQGTPQSTGCADRYIIFRGRQGVISSYALYPGKVYLVMDLLRNDTQDLYVAIPFSE